MGNLINKKFGKLIVLKYDAPHISKGGYERKRVLCKCDCGKEKSIITTSLTSGRTKSCGCLVGKKKGKNLVNYRFGSWLVLEKDIKNSIKRTYWICKCDCGEIRSIPQNNLVRKPKNQVTKSCGCKSNGFKKLENIIGKKYKNLTVIKRVDNVEYECKSIAARWLCKCDCGKEIICLGKNLKIGYSGSCGCKKSDFISDKTYEGFNDLSGAFWYRMKRNAKIRNIEFSITKEYIWDLFVKQNKRCAMSGVLLHLNKQQSKFDKKIIQTASLDRINSNKGYVEGNVWWIHKRIQSIKWDKSVENTYNWCKLIANNYKNNG